MQLFMFIFELILGHARKPTRTFADYGVFFRSDFNRSMPVYIGFSTLICFGKAGCGQLMQVDKRVASPSDNLLVLTQPHGSVCVYLRCIHVLFIFYAAARLA